MLWRFSRLKSLSLMETSTATTCLPSRGSTALSQVCDPSEPGSAGYFIFACWEALNLRQISSFILFATAVLRAVCGLAQLFAESAPFQIDNFSYFFSKAASRVSPLGYVLSQKQVAHGDRFREKCLKFIKKIKRKRRNSNLCSASPCHQTGPTGCLCLLDSTACLWSHTHTYTHKKYPWHACFQTEDNHSLFVSHGFQRFLSNECHSPLQSSPLRSQRVPKK